MSSASPELEIGGAELLDALEPLFAALVEHHGAVAPELGPTYGPEEAWARRRALFDGWIERDKGFVVLVRGAGYAFARRGGASATWPALARVVVVEDLVVADGARGDRLGERLLQAAWDHAGADVLTLDVVTTNVDAKRFYARVGLMPFTETLRVDRRPG